MLFTISLSFILTFLSPLCSTLPLSYLEPRSSICIWPGQGSNSFSCEQIASDKVLGSIEYDIYRFPEVPADSPYISYLDTALSDISGLYSSFLGDDSLDVSIWIVQDFNDVDEAIFAQTKTPYFQCHIRIMTGTGAEARSESGFKATVAHEMYHCVQQSPFSSRVYSDAKEKYSKWWREGTAVFMANYFYPDVNEENPHVNGYDSTLAPFDTDNAYPAGLIFQYLSNIGWTPLQIHTWLLRQTYSTTAEEETTRIAADGDLVAMWPGFATSFVDSKITFKDGQAIKLYHPALSKSFTVPESPLSDFLVDVDPFRINRYETVFDNDKIVSMIFTPEEPDDSKTILQYRKGRSGSFTVATPGERIDLQNVEAGSCSADSQPWEFMITSTNDPSLNTVHKDGESHARMSFSVQSPTRKRQESCDPPPSQSLDQCIVGDWSLDLATMQAFLSDKMSNIADTSITNLVLSGSSTLNIDSTFHSTMTFATLDISYDAVAQGLSFHTEITIDGSIVGNLVMGTQPSSFTWAQDYNSVGTIHTDTIIPSLDTDLPLDFPVTDQYGSQTQVQYVCSGSTLQMTGYVNSKYTWAYTWVKA